MTRPIACRTRWAPGTARSRLRCCGEGADSAPCEARREEHSSLGGGPEAAHDAAPRHRPGRIGMDTHVDHPPYAFEVSPQSDRTPLYAFEVLLQSSHIPRHQHHAQIGLGS